jgi:MFS family permease
MRGRYMATYGLSWAIPSAVAGWAGGLILDNYNPNWLWYAAGIACAVAAAGFVAFHLKTAPHRARAAEETA